MAAGEGSWMVDIQNSVNGLNPATEAKLWENQSIYKVPQLLKDVNKNTYRPLMVSFGPNHHGDSLVKAMEEHKQRALLHFLKRAKKPLSDFVSGMKEILQQLQDSYQDLDQKWKTDRDSFLQLMIVDGCFMLEIIRYHADYSHIDPIFSMHGMLYNVPGIRRDMLMVENQLPLLVLSKLVAVESGNIEICTIEDQINKLVLDFVAGNVTRAMPGIGLALHPLDVYHRFVIQLDKPPSEPLSPRILLSSLEEPFIPCGDSHDRDDGNGNSPTRSALELDEAGIQFEKSESTSLNDIRFDGSVLSLPRIVVDDTTDYLFHNLMTFERLHVGAGNEVTSYVFFMDGIIDSAKDVSLLRSKGIIESGVGSDDAVAAIFNALSKEVVLYDTTQLKEVKSKLNKYCEKKWNGWRAYLIRTYFRSPWSIISLAAAFLLLLLTVATTVYTILSYYTS